MGSSAARWTVKDKARVLLAMMDALAGEAHISFEGDLKSLRLGSINGASDQESPALKRNTRWPEQDFLIVPLEATTIKTVFSAIGGSVPRKILHIQIEKAGVVEFSAYDNFHPGCVVFGQAVKPELIAALASEGILIPCSTPPRG
jgi:hypothetical protein